MKTTQKFFFLFFTIAFALVIAKLFSSCVGKDGKPILPPGEKDVPIDTIVSWNQEAPQSICFYVESSGSMSGFFRSNRATDFKTDVNSIVGFFKPLCNSVKVFTDANSTIVSYSADDFCDRMNKGNFVSSQDTKVPEMFETVINDIHPEKGECAVLISDMIFSPVKDLDLDVRLKQYSSKIRDIVINKQIPISIICAASNFLARNGNTVVQRSPYYYIIIGNQENVVCMRNCIATILQDEPKANGEQSRLIDMMEFGINYGNPTYSFGKTDNVYQRGNELAFVGYDKDVDSCKIDLSLDLSKYPWSLINDSLILSVLDIHSDYGSEVAISNYKLSQNLHDNGLNRTATADLTISISHMPLKADMIIWTMKEIPQVYKHSEFENILTGQDENDRERTFTFKEFLIGLGYAYSNLSSGVNNRILISTTK